MKILFIVKNMRLANGVASFVMNYYRQLKTEIDMDFLVISDVGSPYYEEIKKDGNQIFIMPSYTKNPIAFIKMIKKIFKENKYDIVHSNVVNSASIVLKYAKKYKIPVRILHSHATETGDSILKKIRNIIFKKLSLRYSNNYFACSKLAGDALFENKEYIIIPNAINLQKYAYNEELRNKYRTNEHVQDKLVLMTVGRITKQKNPYFIVDIIKYLSMINKNIILWWFGNGELEENIKQYAINNDVEKYIHFFGASDKINEIYSAADVFILPSLYEGLPVVGIEAQVAGLPVVFADTITREAKLTEFVEYVGINDAKEWIKPISDFSKLNRKEIIKTLNFEEYRIETQARKMKQIYEELLKNKLNLEEL